MKLTLALTIFLLLVCFAVFETALPVLSPSVKVTLLVELCGIIATSFVIGAVFDRIWLHVTHRMENAPGRGKSTP
jgi:hypothetical protein